MKKLIVIAAALMIALIPLADVWGGTAGVARAESNVLRVYNWEEYIDEGIINDFIKWHAIHNNEEVIEVVYANFGTNELMYNELKINPNTYDLVCPSEYMIEKMMVEGMLEKLDAPIDSYKEYASPYIQDLFNQGTDNKLADYAVGYMWGTLGYVYNPEYVDPADAESWSAVWNISYNNKTTLKDSIRDTYFMGVAYTYRSELNKLAAQLEHDRMALAFEHEGNTAAFDAAYKLKADAYNAELTKIFNRTDAATVAKVESALLAVKKNVFSFELDDGKKDMVTGKIHLNFAWSGDAIYAMDQAKGSNVVLNYSVPKEGSNIWFDGWVMPKNANKRLARSFLEFISMPKQAIRNMKYIGYTSAIAGDKVWEWAQDAYAAEDGAEDATEVDLSYFFSNISDEKKTEGRAIFMAAETGRQFSAQYPDYDTVNRSVIMQNFDTEALDRIDKMWQKVKGNTLPMGIIILIVVVVVAAAAVTTTVILLKKRGFFSRKKLTVVKRG